MKTNFILLLLLFIGFQTMAQSVYNYRIREYYSYSEAKKMMVLDSKDQVRSTLTIDDKKKRITLSFAGTNEVAVFDRIIIKGPISANNGKTFLLYIHTDETNEEVHFYISKEAARIESYGAMLQLFE